MMPKGEINAQGLPRELPVTGICMGICSILLATVILCLRAILSLPKWKPLQNSTSLMKVLLGGCDKWSLDAHGYFQDKHLR